MLSCEGADFSKVLKRYDIDLQVEMTPQEMAAKLLPQDPVFHKVAEEVMYMRFKTVGLQSCSPRTLFSTRSPRKSCT